MTSWLRSRSFVIKILGLSTATGIAFRLMYNASNAVENKKLVSVLMLTRHGARTPLHVISGIEEAEYKKDLLEPYVKAKYKLQSLENEDFEDILSFYDQKNNERTLRGGVGRGQLTQLGEKQLFDLGRFIRNKYMHDLHFLSSTYNPDEFYTRSTHYKRTINSAKSLLAGIYLKNHEQVPKEPFVIHIDRLHEDILFPNVMVCPYYSEARAFYERVNLLKNKEYVQNLTSLIKALPKSNGDDANYNFTAFRDDILARKVHDLPVPAHLEPFLELSHRYGNMEITAQHDFDVRISIGMLLNILKHNLLQSVDNDQKKINQNHHKFRLYSAHDTTINAILVAFGLVNNENHEWPPFAASIIIELWRNPEFRSSSNNNDSKYTIKFYYCTEPVSIPECNMNKENECSLDDFLRVMNRNTIEKEEFDKLCNQKFAP